MRNVRFIYFSCDENMWEYHFNFSGYLAKQQGEQSFQAMPSPIWDLTNPYVTLRLYVKYAAAA